MKAILFFIIFIASCSVSLSQNTISLRMGPMTGQDILVLSNFPQTNLNGHPDFLATLWTAQGVQYIGRTYFQFYLNNIPSNATILDARLSLYANPFPINPPHSQEGYDNSAYLYRVQTAWNETSVTWNNQPEYTTLHKVTIPGTNNPYQNYPNINVTQLVRDMVKDPEQSYGFMLVQKDEEFFLPNPMQYPYYRSLNFAPGNVADTALRPLLVITYQPVGISNGNESTPSEYRLSQNFPNPFNPVTNIEFDIPKSGFVTLRIFDQLGRVAAVIVSQNLPRGSYRKQWDASNHSSGQYYIRMETEEGTMTRKMTLVK